MKFIGLEKNLKINLYRRISKKTDYLYNLKTLAYSFFTIIFLFMQNNLLKIECYFNMIALDIINLTT